MFSHTNESGKTRLQVVTVLLIASFLLLTGGLTVFRDAQAYPTNPALLDNFNQPDNTSLANTTASGGYDWAKTQTINTNGTTSLGISNNNLYEATGNSNNAYIDHQFGPDTELSLDAVVPASSGYYVALWSRIQQPGTNSFDSYALVYINNGASATWSLRRYDNASSTQLAAINTPPLSPGDSLGFEVKGTGSTVTLAAYQKSGGTWTSLGSVNDTSASRIISAGYVGIEIGDSTVVAYDNFRGGDVINNVAPAAPQASLPANSATDISVNPQFQLRSTDADGDDLRYKIEICSDAACSNVVRTIDQTASQTGWSGQDKQGNTAYTGGTTIGSSTLAVHNYQAPALDYSTQYWWRAYSIDPSGTNVFSLASSISAFTTEAAPSQGGGNSGSGNNNGSGSANSNTGNSSNNSSSSSSKLDSNLTPSSYTTWGK